MPEKPTLSITTRVTPPYWALLERELLRLQAEAIEEFFARYFDERGYLLCVPRWGGNDGPDDAAENLLNWTMLHALGADDVVLKLYKKGWEGHLRQYTEAKTVEVPLGRDGMYYKEFITCFDWFHNGEALNAFVLQGLSDPHDHNLRLRTCRFAGFYMNDDPQAPNYDPEHRIIRSMFNGSRGPLLRKATALDWAGDPIEVEGRFRPLHGESNYQQFLEHFQEYTDVVGDHPLNLGTTTLALNAYALTGESRYRDWLLEYVNAWVERTRANNGIIPTNVGLDGTLGGECGGRWWGGVYGWGFTVHVPGTGELAHRPSFYNRAFYGFANALLVTGNYDYVRLWGEMIDRVNANARQEGGRTLYPWMYGDQGWYNYRPEPFSPGALEVYYWTMDPRDRERVPPDPWLDFIEGRNPDYPVQALEQDFSALQEKLERMRQDTTTPDTRLSDDPNDKNPATTDALVRLMLGGLPTGRVGYPLHCRLRYFDPERRRAGIPPDVSALVERMTADETVVTLVNANPVRGREVVVQGGAYGEHRILTAEAEGTTVEVNSPHLTVRLAPGAGARITLTMQRYANRPTLSFPWE